MSKIIKVRDQNTGEIFGSLVCNKQKILSSEYEEEQFTSDNKILLDQDEVIEEDDDFEKIVYIECIKEDKDINDYEVIYFDIQSNNTNDNNVGQEDNDKSVKEKNNKQNGKEKQSEEEDEDDNEELEALQDRLDDQRQIFTKLVKNSLESLKLVGKIFSLKTDKKNFVQNSIEKLKTKIEQKKNEDNEQLESFELKLKTHFWNIHEVYLNILKKQQDKIDQFTNAIKTSCQSFSEYQNKILFEGCCNQQRIEYIRDLFLKFVKLGDSDKLYKEVISAMLDVFDMKPDLKKKFFDNLKKIQLINQSNQSMEQTEKKFQNFKTNFQNEYNDFNLNCICVQETSKLVLITALYQFTNIKNAVVFKKKKKRVKSVSPNEIQIKNKAKQYHFSLFIGNLVVKNQNFLIFAEKVKNCIFDNSKTNIFQIASVKLIAMDQCEDVSLYEESFNKIFQKGFYFSYNKDLTYPLNQKKKQKLKQPKWIFYINRSMHRIFQNDKLNEWITPIIFGDVGMMNRYDFQGNCFQFSYFKRISIIDMLQKDLTDPLIANFTVSNSFQQYDFQYISQKKQKLFMSFVVSNIYDSSSDFKKVLRYFNFLSHKFKIKEFYATQNAETNFENCLNVMESFPYLVRMLKVNDLLQIYYSFNKYIKGYLEEKNSVFSISATDEDNFNDEKIFNLMACFVCFCNANVDDQKNINFNEDEKLLEEIKKFSMQELHKSKDVIQNLKDIINGIDKNQKIVKQIRIMFISLLNQQYPVEQIRKQKVFKLSQNLMNLIYGNFFEDMEDLIKNYKIEDKNLFNTTNLKIAFLTHNCEGYLPVKKSQKEDLKWMQNEDINNSDILIIGFQEIIEMKSKNLQRIVLEYSESHTENWIQFFQNNLNKKFKLFYHKNLVGLLLFIFIKEKQFNNYMFKVQNVVIERLGKLNLANKGAVLVQLDINFQTFTFINCHLESGTNLQKAFTREENFSKLVETSNSLPKSFGIFVLGDMNFRNYTTYKDILELKFKEDKKFEQIFVDNDELKQSQLLERFKYKEMKIQFCPSYKFKKNSNEYYIKKGKRIPSYTDRIVYYTLEEDIFKPLRYFKDKETKISDHRPVILIGDLKILQFDTQKFQNILDQLNQKNQISKIFYK